MTARDRQLYRFFRKSLLALGIATSIPQMVYAQDLRVRLGHEVELSSPDTDNHNPAVSVSPDNRTFAVWESLNSTGQRRIVFRERVIDQWLPPVIIDADPAGDNRMPTISVDSLGRPHVAWIANVGGLRRPVYAARLGAAGATGEWVVLPVPDPGRGKLSGACDFVNLRLDASDSPWIAWQCGYGSVYTIVASTLLPLGTMESFNLTPAATGHNLYPEILWAEGPVIAWYAAQQDSFELDAKRFVPPTDWLPFEVENLDKLPSESFPNVFQHDAGPVTAVWYDRIVDDSTNNNGTDRIFLGEQSVEQQGSGRIIDEHTDAKNTSVAGDRSAQAIMAVWASRQKDARVDIVLSYGASADTMDTIKINRSEHLAAGNPKVASHDSSAAIIWESDADVGSIDGDILFRDARFF